MSGGGSKLHIKSDERNNICHLGCPRDRLWGQSALALPSTQQAGRQEAGHTQHAKTLTLFLVVWEAANTEDDGVPGWMF